MLRTVLCSFALIGLLFVPAPAAIIAEYRFNDTTNVQSNYTGPAAVPSPSFDPTFVSVGATSSRVALGQSVIARTTQTDAPVPADIPFLWVNPNYSYVDPLPTTTAERIDLAVANNRFFEFTVAPTAGNLLNLTSLTFQAARGGSSADRGFSLRTNLDSYGSQLAGGNIPSVRATYTNYDIDLTGSAYQNLTEPVTFRFYVYSPAAGSSVDFDNFVLNGSVEAIPEPGLLVLAGLAAGGLFVLRRRPTWR
jgi:hypothetical protein